MGIPHFCIDGGCRQYGGKSSAICSPREAFGTWEEGSTSRCLKGGRCFTAKRAAIAAYTQAGEQYRSTVLTAFQNVADTLHAIQQDADGLKAASAAKHAAAVTLDLTKKQFDGGYANYLALLSAEQSHHRTPA